MNNISDQEYWDIKDVFHDKMLSLLKDFENHLFSTGLTKGTVNKYSNVAWAFIDYIQHYTDHLTFESITVANANSRFIAKAKQETLYDWDSKVIKSKLKKFIEYLDERGYKNEKILKSLKKK